jgi:hypothetical protein
VSDNDHYAGAAGCDLSHAVTVFVTTVGAPTFPPCMAHLRQQNCRFRLQVIDHVAPMHVAFQRMLDECRTPYYVQVDEDMLLYPHAVRTLYDRIEAAGAQTAMFVADLFDVHLQRCLFGVKIFRHAVSSRYRFSHVNAFETVQVEQMLADGFQVIRTAAGESPIEGETLGLHGTHWTPGSIYERYLTLQRRRRRDSTRLHWLPPYAEKFLQRFLQEPSENNFFALMGIVAGTLGDGTAEICAKDYRTYAALPGFATLREFYAEVSRAPVPGESAADAASAGSVDERRNQPGV